jgi:hypothetical protein
MEKPDQDPTQVQDPIQVQDPTPPQGSVPQAQDTTQVLDPTQVLDSHTEKQVPDPDEEPLYSYEYNISRDYFDIEEVTGTFFKLTRKYNNNVPKIIYVPRGTNGINEYLKGGTKQNKTRKNRRNRRNSRKSNRRR